MIFWIIAGLCAVFSTILCVSCIIVGARSEHDKAWTDAMDENGTKHSE